MGCKYFTYTLDDFYKDQRETSDTYLHTGCMCPMISRLLRIRKGSFAKEPYKTEDILQKRPTIRRSLLIIDKQHLLAYRMYVSMVSFIKCPRVYWDVLRFWIKMLRYWSHSFHLNGSLLINVCHFWNICVAFVDFFSNICVSFEDDFSNILVCCVGFVTRSRIACI